MSFDRSSFRIDLTPDQLVKAFERERALDRLEELMAKLKGVDIDEETIRKEVEIVRAKRYAAWKKKPARATRRR